MKSLLIAGDVYPRLAWDNYKAAPGFEPGVEVLQTSALPLGYAAAEVLIAAVCRAWQPAFAGVLQE
jgi:hypothetical protein